MKKNELPEYTAYLIEEYYKNNIQPFLNAFSERCLWIGPAKGQMIYSKKKLLEAFSQENNELTFEMQNLQIIPISAGSQSLDVLLTYSIITYYPNGDSNVFQQRTELLWVEEKVKNEEGKTVKDYFIRLCHISNEFPYDSRDTIYPNHFQELDIAKVYTGQTKMSKIAIKGLYNSYFYLSDYTIMWIESNGTHSLIHTKDKVYESIESVTTIAKKFPDTLLKIHASYVINPTYVLEIGRFYVTMADGKQLNIPEKKYTQTRDEIHRRMNLVRHF